VGVPYSSATGLPIESQTVSQMADRILALPEGTRLYLLAPIVRGRKGEYKKELAELQKKGFQRAKVDGKFYDIGATPALDKKLKHDIEIVVDRIVVKPDIGNRLPDSIETALNLADGLLVVEFADEKEKDGKPKQMLLSSKFACPVSGFTIPEIEPRLFSFNNPHGACPECDGLGVQNYFDEALVVPDESLTLKKGAIAPWAKSSSPYYLQTLEALARHYKFSMDKPWAELPEKAHQAMLTVFNWTEASRTRAINLAQVGLKDPAQYELVDVLEDKNCCAMTDGSIKLDQKPHSVRMIKLVDKSVPSNAPPVNVQAPSRGSAGEALTFQVDAGSPQDPVLSCHWDFGDGTSADGLRVLHAYTRSGEYPLVVSVTGLGSVANRKTLTVAITGSIATRFDPTQIRRAE